MSLVTSLTVIQGSDVSFNLRFNDQEINDPLDMTNCTACVVTFLNADGTFLSKSLGSGVTLLTPLTLGKVSVVLDEDETALLAAGRQSFEVTLTISAAIRIAQFAKALNVLQSVFS
jgi:hypothetical protein